MIKRYIEPEDDLVRGPDPTPLQRKTSRRNRLIFAGVVLVAVWLAAGAYLL